MILVRWSLSLIFFSAMAVVFSSPFAFADATTPDLWKRIAANDVAEVMVEKTLYTEPNAASFLVHVRIHNKSDKEIGFDAVKSSSVFYINQFVESDTPSRSSVDEMRMMSPPISEERANKIKALFANNNQSATFVHLAPGKDFEYFVPFQGSGDSLSQIRKSTAKYVILVIDGHIVLTDGTVVSKLERDNSDTVAGEVPVPLPAKIQPLPSASRIIGKMPNGSM